MSFLIVLLASLFALSASPAAEAPDPGIEAHAQIRTLVAGIQLIERIRGKTPRNAFDGNCVDEKLAEARAGLQIAGGELARVEASLKPQDAPDRDYALRRLRLLRERSAELIRAARVCATEDLSSIDTTKVEVQVAPAVPAGDPTALPWGFQHPGRPPR